MDETTGIICLILLAIWAGTIIAENIIRKREKELRDEEPKSGDDFYGQN